MPTCRVDKTVTINGESFTCSNVETSGEALTVKPGTSQTLAAAKTGSLTTRTSATEGIITSNGHGYTTGTLAVHWTDATTGLAKKRYGCTFSEDENTVTISAGAGDDLPDALSTVSIFNEVSANFAVDGDDLVALVVHCTQIGHCEFRTAVPGLLQAVHIAAANNVYEWTLSSGATNPQLGLADCATVRVSNGSTTAAVMTIGAVFATS